MAPAPIQGSSTRLSIQVPAPMAVPMAVDAANGTSRMAPPERVAREARRPGQPSAAKWRCTPIRRYAVHDRRKQMNETPIETRRLRLVPKTLTDVRARIDEMDATVKAELSSEWLARLDAATVDLWTLGFAMVHRISGAVVGTCGFKGPPGADGTVEIAYGVSPDQQGKGYATEATEALVAYAFSADRVRLVRAHTFAAANASTRVLTKCGFQAVGEVIDPEDGLVWRWELQHD
jgi:RimJ/RimL family protein N-acetyltransferase